MTKITDCGYPRVYEAVLGAVSRWGSMHEYWVAEEGCRPMYWDGKLRPSATYATEAELQQNGFSCQPGLSALRRSSGRLYLRQRLRNGRYVSVWSDSPMDE